MTTETKARMAGWKNGWTWLHGCWVENTGGMAPAFEVRWDAAGNPEHTGRRAWMRANAILASQETADPPGRYEPVTELGERLLDDDEYRELIMARNPLYTYKSWENA